MGGETAQTLDRGIRVLYLLGDQPGGLTVAELAGHLDVARSIAYRLIATLERRGLVSRGGDSRYRLGLGILAISRSPQALLRHAVRPVLRELAQVSASTSYLAVAEGDDALTVAVAEPIRVPVHVAVAVGQRVPMGSSAAGMAIIRSREDPSPGAMPDPIRVQVAPGSPVLSVATAVYGAPGLEAAIGILSIPPAGSADTYRSVAEAARQLTQCFG